MMNLRHELAKRGLKSLIKNGINDFIIAHPGQLDKSMVNSLEKRIFGKICNFFNDIDIKSENVVFEHNKPVEGENVCHGFNQVDKEVE